MKRYSEKDCEEMCGLNMLDEIFWRCGKSETYFDNEAWTFKIPSMPIHVLWVSFFDKQEIEIVGFMRIWIGEWNLQFLLGFRRVFLTNKLDECISRHNSQHFISTTRIYSEYVVYAPRGLAWWRNWDVTSNDLAVPNEKGRLSTCLLNLYIYRQATDDAALIKCRDWLFKLLSKVLCAHVEREACNEESRSTRSGWHCTNEAGLLSSQSKGWELGERKV